MHNLNGNHLGNKIKGFDAFVFIFERILEWSNDLYASHYFYGPYRK
jgi:hypothetical protein